MGLRSALRRAAASHPGVLLVGLPGSTAIRLEAESALRSAGWPVATGPADANMLVVTGALEPSDTERLGAMWRQVPTPRACVVVSELGRVETALQAGAGLLAQGGQELEILALQQPPCSEEVPGHTEHAGHSPGDAAPHHPDSHGEHEAHGEGHGEGHGEHNDHAEPGEHHGHAGHDMGSMEVAGLPMADRADDRDGLRLDLLHLRLGPALPDWPSGLVLHVSMQGDVVQQAEVERVAPRAAAPVPFWNEPWLRAVRGERVSRGTAARRRCAAHLDSLGRFLAVAGWADPAVRARRLRDTVLSPTPADDVRAAVARLTRQVSRSRTLRWLTAGIGPLRAPRVHELGVLGPALTADGDVHDRIRVWLEEIDAAADKFGDERPLDVDDTRGPRGPVDAPRPASQTLLDALPELLRGAEFAAARLIVASLDPDLDELVAAPVHGMAHG